MTGSTLPVVDSHLHFWDPQLLDYPWLTHTPLDYRFGPEDLDTGTITISGLVVVQGGCAPHQALAEADWISRLHGDSPQPSAIVAHAPLEKGAAVSADLALLEMRPLVTGVRRLFQSEATEFITDTETLQGAREVSDMGYTFDACVRHDQLDALADFAVRLPELVIILDHMGKPPIAGGHRGDWRTAMRRLAALPNVTVKLSGAAPEADPGRSLAGQALPYLSEALELFGPDRCMFGSDWPVSAPRRNDNGSGYEEWTHLVLDTAMDGATAEQRAEVASGTATRIYRLERK